jgi:hypothetical protein
MEIIKKDNPFSGGMTAPMQIGELEEPVELEELAEPSESV